jgi:hypothetical protein
VVHFSHEPKADADYIPLHHLTTPPPHGLYLGMSLPGSTYPGYIQFTVQTHWNCPLAEVTRVQKPLLLAALLGCGLAPAGPGQALPPPSAPAPALARLVEQLGDADYRKRDEAVRRLTAEGVKAVPALRKALGHPDAEVRRRAGELIPALERAAVLAPRRVTLKVTNKPLRAVFDEMTRQTSYKVQFFSGKPDQAFTFDFQGLTFWEALDRVCGEGGLVLQQHFGDDQVHLQQREGPPAQYVHYDGSFRFVPNSFQQVRTIDFGPGNRNPFNGQSNEQLSFQFTVCAEPKLPLLGLGAPRLTAAYDSEKNSMLVPENGNPDHMNRLGMNPVWGSRYGGGNRCLCIQTSVNLHRPAERATRIKLLRGTIPATLLAEQKDVVVTDNILAAKGKTVKVGTTTFQFKDVSAQPNKQYQLRLAITEDNKDNPNDYTWMNSLYQRISLQDAKGNKYFPFSTTWTNSSPNHAEITMTYGQMGNAKAGAPSRFVYQSWTTLQHQLAFEFKDLPLP